LYPDLHNILLSNVHSFAIKTIKDLNNPIYINCTDYDVICVHNTVKTSQKAFTLFIITLMNQSIIAMEDVYNSINAFVLFLQEHVVKKENEIINICDEIIDILCIFISNTNFDTVQNKENVHLLRDIEHMNGLSMKSKIMLRNAFEKKDF
jgi:hypothetical protein